MSDDLPSDQQDASSEFPVGLRANASSRYHATLEEAAADYPLATEALMRSDRHRLRRWQQFIDSVDVEAIERLLGFLRAASLALAADNATGYVDFLPARIADDVRIALEGILSGYLQVASDAMRDIIETELLIRDFALDPSQIERWRKADKRTRRLKFQAVELRKRQASALRVKPEEVPGATDYAAHSGLLHVGPELLFARSPDSGHQVLRVLDAITDIMFHGRSAVDALNSLLAATQVDGPEPESARAALEAAISDLGTASAAVEALARRVAKSLQPAGEWVVAIFENGLVVALSPDRRYVETYGSARLDFRRFHREVSREHPAEFELTPLGRAARSMQDPKDPT